jgi:TonB family protein
MTHRGQFAAISCGCVVFALAAVWYSSQTPEALPPVESPRTVAEMVPPPPPGPPPTLGDEPIVFSYGTASYVQVGTGHMPRRLTDRRPVHPPIARANGIAGTVVVDATVDSSGRVVDPLVRQSVPMLDQAAVDAVRQWRFEPSPATHSRKQAIRASVVYR